MGGNMKFASAIVVTGAFLASASPAIAGRCGHSYPVDKPTTLTEVARQCNVNLSALYEANPGVDPSNVRPGEHLSVPDEIESYTPALPQISQNAAVASTQSNSTSSPSHPYIVSPDNGATITDDYGMNSYNDISNFRGDDARAAQRIRVRDNRTSSSNPIWLREENLGARRHVTADRLSYQQLSAMRIQEAGFPAPPRFASMTPVTPTQVSTTSSDIQLIECPVLRQSTGGKIHKVRKIISTPENTFVEIKANPTAPGFDCTLINVTVTEPLALPVPTSKLAPATIGHGYRVPDYNKIGVMPTDANLSMQKISLSGDVVGADDGCLILRDANNTQWRLAAAPPSGELIGKHVTVWGVAARTGTCGAGPSMLVSHAVYAEPWAR